MDEAAEIVFPTLLRWMVCPFDPGVKVFHTNTFDLKEIRVHRKCKKQIGF